MLASRNSGMTASDIREILKVIKDGSITSFAGGIPDPTLFPRPEITSAFEGLFADQARYSDCLQYSVTEGNPKLREWLAGYMGRRGFKLSPNHILLTNGSQQALDLIGKIFLDPHDKVVVTRPTYLGAIQAFNAYQPEYIEVASDDAGPTAERMEAALRQKPKFIYLVPDFQNPTGNTISVERRGILVQLAKKYHVPIIEDAAYEQLYFSQEAYPPLAAIAHGSHPDEYDQSECPVIYCGTFSKTLAPGFRVGWVTAPDAIIHRLILAKQAADLHTNSLGQEIVYQVANQCFESHTAELRKAYKAKRDTMLAALEHSFGKQGASLNWSKPNGGLFVWLEFPEDIDTRKLLTGAIAEAKVAFVPGQAFFPRKDKLNTCRMSFSCPSHEQIRDGVARLADLYARKAATFKS